MWLVVSFGLSACYGPTPPAPVLAFIDIVPGGVLLQAVGDSKALSALLVDHAGAPFVGVVTWESSDPSVVAVASDGTVTAVASRGASQVTARLGGVVSGPVVVLVAELVPEAVPVLDAQVLALEPVVPEAEFGLGYRYRVTLDDPPAVAVGDLLVGVETATIAGRVVGVALPVVTLEVVDIDEVFVDLQLEAMTVDLSRSEYQLSPEAEELFDLVRLADGSYELIAKVAEFGFDDLEGLDPLQDKPSFTCTAPAKGISVAIENPGLTVQPNFSLDLAWNDAQKKIAVVGNPFLGVDMTAVVRATLATRIVCKLKLLEPKLPMPGALGAFLGAALPAGMRLEFGVARDAAEIGFRVKGGISAEVGAGMVCLAGSDCQFVAEFELVPVPLEVTPILEQALADVFVVDVGLFVFADLEVGVTSGPVARLLERTGVRLRAQLAQAKVGVKLSAALASVDEQVAFDDAVAEYDLAVLGKLEAGSSISAALGLLKVELKLLEIEYGPFEVSRSPVADGFHVSERNFASGDEVVFTVDLDADHTTFLGVHNVDEVLIYGLFPLDDVPLLLASSGSVVPGQLPVVVTWPADRDAQPGARFFAFVKTRLLPVIELKLADTVLLDAVEAFSVEMTVRQNFTRDEDLFGCNDVGCVTTVITLDEQVVVALRFDAAVTGGLWQISDLAAESSASFELFQDELSTSTGGNCFNHFVRDATGTVTGHAVPPSTLTTNGANMFIFHSISFLVQSVLFRESTCTGEGPETEEVEEEAGASLDARFPIGIDPSDPATFQGVYEDTVVDEIGPFPPYTEGAIVHSRHTVATWIFTPIAPAGGP
jgi:hypothetical protein